MRNTLWTKAWPAAAVAAAAMVWTTSVFLSDDTGSPWDGPMPMSNIIMPEDADRYAKALGLDGDQRGFLDALYEVYRAGLEEVIAQNNVETMTRGFIEDPDEAAAFTETKGARRDEVELTFFRDLRLGLNAEQLERWPALERLRRREQNPVLLMDHIVGWTDMVSALHEINPEAIEDETIGKLVQQFEMEDDTRRRAVILLNEEYKASIASRGAVFAPDPADEDRERTMNNATIERGESAFALLNRLRRLLDPEDGNRLLRSCLGVDPSDAERDIERALDFDDLTDAQREEILTLRNNHQRRAWPIDENWLETGVQHQRKGAKHARCAQLPRITDQAFRPQCELPTLVRDEHGKFVMVPPADPVEPCPFDQIRQKRSEAHAHTSARLQNILNAAQTKRLTNRAQREQLQRAVDSAQRSVGRAQRELDWAREHGHDTATFEGSLAFPKERLQKAIEELEAFEKAAATP